MVVATRLQARRTVRRNEDDAVDSCQEVVCTIYIACARGGAHSEDDHRHPDRLQSRSYAEAHAGTDLENMRRKLSIEGTDGWDPLAAPGGGSGVACMSCSWQNITGRAVAASCHSLSVQCRRVGGGRLEVRDPGPDRALVTKVQSPCAVVRARSANGIVCRTAFPRQRAFRLDGGQMRTCRDCGHDSNEAQDGQRRARLGRGKARQLNCVGSNCKRKTAREWTG